MRQGKPTCGHARPTPGASCISLSILAATWRTRSVVSSIGRARARSFECGYCKIVSFEGTRAILADDKAIPWVAQQALRGPNWVIWVWSWNSPRQGVAGGTNVSLDATHDCWHTVAVVVFLSPLGSGVQWRFLKASERRDGQRQSACHLPHNRCGNAHVIW